MSSAISFRTARVHPRRSDTVGDGGARARRRGRNTALVSERLGARFADEIEAPLSRTEAGRDRRAAAETNPCDCSIFGTRRIRRPGGI